MAYAAVISLKYTLIGLENFRITRSAYEDLKSLGSILKGLDGSSNRSINRSAINALDEEIREAVYKLEDAIQSHYLLPRSLPDMIEEEIRSVRAGVQKLKEQCLRELHNLRPNFDGNKRTTLGFWDQFEKIRTELLDPQHKAKVVLLAGMKGVGKTNVATQIYGDRVIHEQFDFRAWLEAGPQQQIKNVWAEIGALLDGVHKNAYMETNIITLFGLLQKSLITCIAEEIYHNPLICESFPLRVWFSFKLEGNHVWAEIVDPGEDKPRIYRETDIMNLCFIVKKILNGREQCLIVLDDIHRRVMSDELISLFKVGQNGWRFLLISWESVITDIWPSIHIHFVDKEESWRLLETNVFGKNYAPPQLEKAGRKIAENCEGLRLPILTIADILCGLEKTEKNWGRVADLKTTTFTDAHVKVSKQLLSSYEYLQREMDSFSLTVKTLKVQYLRELNNPLPLPEEGDTVTPIPDVDGNMSVTVGLWDQYEQIRSELLDMHSEPKVVALFGMAGIGKTHLATQIYKDPLIVETFDFRLWVRVGPQQQMKNVWAEIAALVEGVHRNVYMETNIITLVGILQKSLSGRRRCLIVLDDIWSTKACDTLIKYLRAYGDGRRILLTTRLEEVAKCHSSSIHCIRFLDMEESWKLLQLKVFGDNYFPRQLEKAGRKIAENCEGLPLLILAVAEILCGLDKTEEYWSKVADSKTNTFTDAYDRISKVLFTSYEYLPQYLKPCFLYMAVFPQKSVIPLPKLLNLWIVEDVLEPQPSLIRTRKEVNLFESIPSEHRAARPSSVDPSMKPRGAIMMSERRAASPSSMNQRNAIIRVTRTSELDPFTEQSETRIARASKIDWASKTNCSKTCRHETMKPLESLYLLEPGPSPTRFIKPWEKNESWDSRLRLTRDLWNPTRKMPLPTAMDIHVPKVKMTPKGIAMEHIKKLVSHSISIICKQSSTNKIKSCKLHSAYWYLCVKEARKNKFFHVLKRLTDASNGYMESQRRLSVQTNMLFGLKEVHDAIAAASTAHSLLCTGPDQEYPVPLCLNFRLLKVLDAVAIRLYDFPTEVVKLLELRYLALTHNGLLPTSISRLQQLQYLIVREHHNIILLRDSTCWPEVRRTEFLRNSTCLPKQIWDMKELVYLRIMKRNLQDPYHDAELPKLSTLHVNAHSCTEAVFRSIPFLKKLGIIIELLPDTAETLSCFEHINLLERLHSLKCVIVNPRQSSKVVAPPDHLSNLPTSLKKLSLNGMGYSWEHMGLIGSLPRLKVLKLRYSAFQGAEWITMAGEFRSLEYLLLEDIDLVHWTTDDDDDDCFPSLQCLITRDCYKLREIPSQIGCIPTLKMIEVVDCSPSLVASAQQIKEKRNPSVQVVIDSSWSRR